MEEKTDAELVEIARQGNKAAFGELVQRYQTLALVIARRMVSHDACARSWPRMLCFRPTFHLTACAMLPVSKVGYMA